MDINARQSLTISYKFMNYARTPEHAECDDLFATATVALAYFLMCSRIPMYHAAIDLCDEIIAQRFNQNTGWLGIALYREFWMFMDEDMKTFIGLITLIEKNSESFSEYRAIEIMMDGLSPIPFAHYVKTQCLLRMFQTSEAGDYQIESEL